MNNKLFHLFSSVFLKRLSVMHSTGCLDKNVFKSLYDIGWYWVTTWHIWPALFTRPVLFIDRMEQAKWSQDEDASERLCTLCTTYLLEVFVNNTDLTFLSFLYKISIKVS